ncbi:MAG: histidinol-phosphate transaminase [Calditrichaceae bacterium]|nr:histidinol-phosphate transaminase [Calditrichaceae bacterium]
MINLESLVRENIRNLKPYSSARDEFKGKADIFLDANENSLGSPIQSQWNRYPDPRQTELKKAIGKLKDVTLDKIFLGNGSDEAIDLLIRAFCEPGRDQIMIMPPTYGMYQVCADINNVGVISRPLAPNFNLDVIGITKVLTDSVKMLFICSPNNPTANAMRQSDIEQILQNTNAIVVVDEAYIDFSGKPSLVPLLDKYPNLVILQTFSKAWGLASLRLGMAFADPYIIHILTNIKPPYNISGLTQQMAMEAIKNLELKNKMVAALLDQRKNIMDNLKQLTMVDQVFSSDTNFILVRFKNSKLVFEQLIQSGIIVRDRSKALHCENCLRFTVGTELENKRLIEKLKSLDT